jgi:hypothetical protein
MLIMLYAKVDDFFSRYTKVIQKIYTTGFVCVL